MPFSAASAGPPTANDDFMVGGKGFGFESRDGANSFYTHWLVAADFQSFVAGGPPGVVARDSFVLESAGLQLDAVLHRIVHSGKRPRRPPTGRRRCSTRPCSAVG